MLRLWLLLAVLLVCWLNSAEGTGGEKRCTFPCRRALLRALFSGDHPLISRNPQPQEDICKAFNRYKWCRANNKGTRDPSERIILAAREKLCGRSFLWALREHANCVKNSHNHPVFGKCVHRYKHDNPKTNTNFCGHPDEVFCKTQEASENFLSCVKPAYEAACSEKALKALKDFTPVMLSVLQTIKDFLDNPKLCKGTCESCLSVFLYKVFSKDHPLISRDFLHLGEICATFGEYHRCVEDKPHVLHPSSAIIKLDFPRICNDHFKRKVQHNKQCIERTQAHEGYKKCLKWYDDERPRFADRCFIDDSKTCELGRAALQFIRCTTEQYQEKCGVRVLTELRSFPWAMLTLRSTLTYELHNRDNCEILHPKHLTTEPPTTPATTPAPTRPPTTRPTTPRPNICEPCRQQFLSIILTKDHPLILPNVKEFPKICWAFKRYHECSDRSNARDPGLAFVKDLFRGVCSSVALQRLIHFETCIHGTQQRDGYKRCVAWYKRESPDFDDDCIKGDRKVCKLQKTATQFLSCATNQYKSRCGTTQANVLSIYLRALQRAVDALKYHLRDSDSCDQPTTATTGQSTGTTQKSTTAKSTKATTPKSTKATTPKSTKATTPKSTKATTPKSTKATTPKSTKATTPKSTKATTPKSTKATTPKSTKATTPKSSKATTPKSTKVTTPKSTKATTPKSTKATTPKSTKATTPKSTKGTTPKSTKATTPKSTKETTPKSTKATTPKSTKATTPNPTTPRPNICEPCRQAFLSIILTKDHPLILTNVRDYAKICWAFKRYHECRDQSHTRDPGLAFVKDSFRHVCSSTALRRLTHLQTCIRSTQWRDGYKRCVTWYKKESPDFGNCIQEDGKVCKLRNTATRFLSCAASQYRSRCGNTQANILGIYLRSLQRVVSALRYQLTHPDKCDGDRTTPSPPPTRTTPATTPSTTPTPRPTTTKPGDCETCRSTFLYRLFTQDHPLILANVREYSKICWAFKQYHECQDDAGGRDPGLELVKGSFRTACSRLRHLVPLQSCIRSTQRTSGYRRCVTWYKRESPDFNGECFEGDDKICKLQKTGASFLNCAAGRYRSTCGTHRANQLTLYLKAIYNAVQALKFELNHPDKCKPVTTTRPPTTTRSTTKPTTRSTTTTRRTTTTTTTKKPTTTTTKKPTTTTTTKKPTTTTTTTKKPTTTTTKKPTTTTTTKKPTTTTTKKPTTTTTKKPKDHTPMGAKLVGYSAKCATGHVGETCSLHNVPDQFGTCTHDEFGLTEGTAFSILVYVVSGRGLYLSCDLQKGNTPFFNIPSCLWAGEIVAYVRKTCYENDHPVDEEYLLNAVDPYQPLECGRQYKLKTVIARPVTVDYVESCVFTEITVDIKIGCATYGFPDFPFEENHGRIFHLFSKTCPAPKCAELH